MDWILGAVYWYLMLLVLQFSVLRITTFFFHRFFDRGYPFAKTLGILLVSYAAFLLGTIKLVPFTQVSLFGIVGAFFLISFFVPRKTESSFSILRIFFAEELLFIGAFVFLIWIRGQEPSIRGLEKFMDFGFINSIGRSTHFPPLDMWYSREPINYYFFGHLTGAMLIKLTSIPSSIGYNFILATIFAQAVTLSFSLCTNLMRFFKVAKRLSVIYGFLGSAILNLGGNLHTIYLFTKGYPADKPEPFWNILSFFNPGSYWYPNATRFIPLTIHEFPSYSYVVADLHGHVFDIPFVLVTLSVLLLYVMGRKKDAGGGEHTSFAFAGIAGGLCAIHYMTNAFDGPIYLLLWAIVFFVYRTSLTRMLSLLGTLILSFITVSLPFSLFFRPFATQIGVNCSPTFLTSLGKIGPFIFEKGNCQPDPLWMLFVLWGFFWISFALFIIVKWKTDTEDNVADDYAFLLFSFGTLLILIPEFFYVKDIYPAHFRANTMFKLGYQAFIMMSVATGYTFFRIGLAPRNILIPAKAVMGIFLFFVLLYPFFSFPSYYGTLKKMPQLDGSAWIKETIPENYEIIQYLNAINVHGQPTILEAQGDSYTDFNNISAYTGLPTVAGWFVHQWLWRGTSEAVGKRSPDISAIYTSQDIQNTTRLLKKYGITFVIVTRQEKEKYPGLNESQFLQVGQKVVTSGNGFGALYQIKQ